MAEEFELMGILPNLFLETDEELDPSHKLQPHYNSYDDDEDGGYGDEGEHHGEDYGEEREDYGEEREFDGEASDQEWRP